LRYGAALMFGRLPGLPDVRIICGRSVRIDGPAPQPVQADGDIVTSLPVEIGVAEKTLRLVVPC
jgi:diacylglycerol kinase family enzyme